MEVQDIKIPWWIWYRGKVIKEVEIKDVPWWIWWGPQVLSPLRTRLIEQLSWMPNQIPGWDLRQLDYTGKTTSGPTVLTFNGNYSGRLYGVSQSISIGGSKIIQLTPPIELFYAIPFKDTHRYYQYWINRTIFTESGLLLSGVSPSVMLSLNRTLAPHSIHVQGLPDSRLLVALDAWLEGRYIEGLHPPYDPKRYPSNFPRTSWMTI